MHIRPTASVPADYRQVQQPLNINIAVERSLSSKARFFFFYRHPNKIHLIDEAALVHAFSILYTVSYGKG